MPQKPVMPAMPTPPASNHHHDETGTPGTASLGPARRRRSALGASIRAAGIDAPGLAGALPRIRLAIEQRAGRCTGRQQSQKGIGARVHGRMA